MAEKILTSDRVLITIEGLPGDWDTCSEPSASRDIVKFRRSADGQQEVAAGRLTYDNVTVTRVWAEARDSAILRQLKSNPDFYNGRALLLTHLGADGLALGQPDTYIATVEKFTAPGSDANSGEQSKLSLELAIASGA